MVATSSVELSRRIPPELLVPLGGRGGLDTSVHSVAAAALRLAVLHGSQARADAAEGSDWDIGVLADDSPDMPALSAALTEILGTDEVDVVDLSRTSALRRWITICAGSPSTCQATPGTYSH